MAGGADAFAALDALAPGFWVGWCSFELGHAVERVVARGASTEPASVPDAVFARFDALAVVDARGACPRAGQRSRTRAARRTRSSRTRHATRPEVPAIPATHWQSGLDRGEYSDRVDAVLELLRAGECYQVNLTRRLTCDEAIDPVALSARSSHAHPAPHPRCSISPTSVVGTRGRVGVARAVPAACATATSRPGRSRAPRRRARRCARSAKDRAENVMIVDLARNDLGRVCEPGSIRVPALCAVEAHPGLHHLVSTVRGTLRADVGLGALLRATFPPASVTGAPEAARAPGHRGPRAGPARRLLRARRWIDTRRRPRHVAPTSPSPSARSPCWSPTAARLHHFGVGAGIVADSDPAAEWAETELKAARLLAVAGAARRRGPLVTARPSTRPVRVGQRRARSPPTTPASRRSTTACSSATACSRRCGSTTASRSRGRATSTGSPTPRPGSGSPVPDRDDAARRGRRRCSRPTGSPRPGCASRSPAACAARLGAGRRRARRSSWPSSALAPWPAAGGASWWCRGRATSAAPPPG